MDFGNEDQDEGDEREAGEVIDDDDDDEEVNKENRDKDSDEQETEKIEPEPKKRKERIVKVEEGRRKIKLNRQSLEQEVEGGMYKVLWVPKNTQCFHYNIKDRQPNNVIYSMEGIFAIARSNNESTVKPCC